MRGMTAQLTPPSSSRVGDDGPFHVTTRLGDRTLGFEKPIADPFVNTTITINRWDLLRAVFRRRPMTVSVIVNAPREVVGVVMRALRRDGSCCAALSADPAVHN